MLLDDGGIGAADFRADSQLFEVYFIDFKDAGVTCRKAFGVEVGQVRGVVKAGLQQVLLPVEGDKV
ncbi:hypothetical protein Barb6_03755 [Bacteroidales bacterium Barb6]|nr:hypothetical protein Barb6_03755 [Bacteroidales bacterium Barb6]